MRLHARINPALWVVVAQFAAFWPVWVWHARRLADPSDERWGVAALLMAAVLLWNRPHDPAQDRTPALWPLWIPLAAYLALHRHAPMLVQAGFAVLSLGFALRCWRPLPPAGWGLLALSLPVLPSLDFFLGYPMRVLTGHLAAVVLWCGGRPVGVEGAALRYGGQLILVDAPCSGLRMLWGGLFMALALAGLFGHGWRGTLKMVAAAAVLLVLANALRAAALFYPGAGLITLPAWGHEGVGLLLFAEMAGLLFWMARRGGRRTGPCAA
ncbi:MAG: exosortase/archaeosortase family protein [Candidatus Hydrogenedens sp.]|nr:archaeosortase/exosortase family protein [Candidatus Hydrogenedentota bacterium]NLF57009.1 exosortase/archaeosortase family protein [Candidatus Hydrogenedens sp.]